MAWKLPTNPSSRSTRLFIMTVMLSCSTHARDEVGQDVARRVEVRRRQVDAGDVAAEMILLLDEVDAFARVGQFERRRHAGDAAADDQRVGAHVDRHPLQRLMESDPVDRGVDQGPRLLGRDRPVIVDPAALLPDVGHLQQIRVQSGRLERRAGRSARACAGCRTRRPLARGTAPRCPARSSPGRGWSTCTCTSARRRRRAAPRRPQRPHRNRRPSRCWCRSCTRRRRCVAVPWPSPPHAACRPSDGTGAGSRRARAPSPARRRSTWPVVDRPDGTICRTGPRARASARRPRDGSRT